MTEWLQTWSDWAASLGVYGYVIVAAIVLLETVILLGHFLPGALITVFAGFLCYTGHYDFTTMLLVVYLSHDLGEQINYWLGRLYGRRLFSENAVFLRTSLLREAEARFHGGGLQLFLISQFAGVFRPLSSVVAGASHYSYTWFLIHTAVATFVWALVHVGAGYLFGASWETGVRYINVVTVLIPVVLAGGIVAWYLMRRRAPAEGTVVATPSGATRILFMLNSFEDDAPNRIILETGAAAAASGKFTCEVVALSRGGVLDRQFRERVGRTSTIRMRGLPGPRWVRRFLLILRRAQPDVVHATLVKPTFLGVPLALPMTGARFVLSQNGLHEWSEGPPLFARAAPFLFRSIARHCDAVVGVSRSVCRRLTQVCGLPPAEGEPAGTIPEGAAAYGTPLAVRHLFIHNGLDTERFRPLPETERAAARERIAPGLPADATLIAAAGHLRPVKNHALLIQAAALLRDGGTAFRILIWGAGRERGALKRLIRSNHLEDCVHLAGHTESPETDFAAVDLFVQPSREEAFGLAAAEAMSCGVCVVAARTGGLAELVEHGVNGYLVDAGNADLLAERLAALCADPVRRAAVGAEARRRIVSRFSLSAMTSAYLSLYEQLVRGQTKPV